MTNHRLRLAALVLAAVALAGGSAFSAAQENRTPRSTAVRAEAGVGELEYGPAPVEEPQFDGEFRRYAAIIRVGHDYTLPTGDTVYEVRTVFGDVTLSGHVRNDVTVILGKLHLASTAVVDGSIAAVGGNVIIDPGAAVRGDLVVVGGSLTAPADFAPGGDHVTVGGIEVGNSLRALMPWLERGLLLGRPLVPGLGWVWMVFGVIFFVHLVLNTLFHQTVTASADAVIQKPVTVCLMGLLVLVLTVPVIAILAVTIIGLAVVPFLLCAMLVAGLVGKAGVARAMGRSLVRQSEPDSRLQSLRSFLLGSILIALAYMVPVLGVVTWLLTGLLAIGAVSVALGKKLRREHPQKERAVVAAAGVGHVPPVMARNNSAALPVSETLDAVSATAPPPPPIAGDLGLGAYPRATFMDRLAAFALDCVLVGIAVRIFDIHRPDGWFLLLLFVYHFAFWAWRGTTLGGIVVGLRVVKTDGRDLTFADALVRGLSSVLSLCAVGIGCFWMLYDPGRQMWHDKIAATVVLKVPREMVLS